MEHIEVGDAARGLQKRMVGRFEGDGRIAVDTESPAAVQDGRVDLDQTEAVELRWVERDIAFITLTRLGKGARESVRRVVEEVAAALGEKINTAQDSTNPPRNQRRPRGAFRRRGITNPVAPIGLAGGIVDAVAHDKPHVREGQEAGLPTETQSDIVRTRAGL